MQDARGSRDMDEEEAHPPEPEQRDGPFGWAHIQSQLASAFNRLLVRMKSRALPALPEMNEEQVRAAGAPAGAPAGATAEPRITERMVQAYGIPPGLDREQRKQLGEVLDMFPDACPRWIADKLCFEKTPASQIIYGMIAEPTSFDKYVTREQGRINAKRMHDITNAHFDIDKFIKHVPDHETRFEKKNPVIKQLPYADLALTAMQNEFPNIRLEYFRKVLMKNYFHFYHSYKVIKETADAPKHTRKKIDRCFMKKRRGYVMPWPDHFSDDFVIEYQYAKHEQDIRKYKIEIVETRRRNVEEARRKGELSECAVCLQECTPDDVVSCTKDHPFCKQCVRSTLEPKVNIGVTQLSCLSQGCDAFYATNALSGVLEDVVFDRLVSNVQQQDLKQSRNENVKECPLCNFAMLIEDEDETLFRCPSAECKRVSCLQCRLPDHKPLTCAEAQMHGTALRTMMEEQVAQSQIKVCPTCRRPVFKNEGCDHITCVCRTEFCYQCGGLWKEKDHRVCTQQQLNDPLRAGILAKNAFLAQHPELRDLAQTADPRALVQGVAAPAPVVRDVWYWLNQRRRGRRTAPGQEKRAQRGIAERASREQRQRLLEAKRLGTAVHIPTPDTDSDDDDDLTSTSSSSSDSDRTDPNEHMKHIEDPHKLINSPIVP